MCGEDKIIYTNVITSQAYLSYQKNHQGLESSSDNYDRTTFTRRILLIVQPPDTINGDMFCIFNPLYRFVPFTCKYLLGRKEFYSTEICQENTPARILSLTLEKKTEITLLNVFVLPLCYKIVARCLVDPFQDNIPVRLVNLDSSPVKIRKNYLLGEIHPVIKYDNFVHEDRNSYNISSLTDGINNWVEIGKGISPGDVIEPPNIPYDLKCFKVSSLDTTNNGVQANTPKLPDHLKDLYEKSCVN
ncbi:unnamed protein product [Mytilus coruscus]|uniref:Uncharacterized protein n=1 Tax=Mytilus coruscus TaxID=42192 RepID=A0A6J8BAJ1_MYTCO|nr:unnamed protein product [Mytilus coruscus]